MEPKKPETYIKAVIIVAGLCILLLCALLVQQYRTVRRTIYMDSHPSLLSALHAHGPLSASDASSIQVWMTYDYIGHVFSLPPQYLAQTLHITDARYPRLTISQEAADAHVSKTQMLTETQNAVRAHFTQPK